MAEGQLHAGTGGYATTPIISEAIKHPDSIVRTIYNRTPYKLFTKESVNPLHEVTFITMPQSIEITNASAIMDLTKGGVPFVISVIAADQSKFHKYAPLIACNAMFPELVEFTFPDKLNDWLEGDCPFWTAGANPKSAT